jgi:hypothetical protein
LLFSHTVLMTSLAEQRAVANTLALASRRQTFALELV